MIDLSKNDVVDTVFNRYVESYRCTLDLVDFMPRRDIDSFFSFLRKNMLKDFKRVNKEAKKLRRAKIRDIKRMTKKNGVNEFKQILAVPEKTAESESETLPQTDKKLPEVISEMSLQTERQGNEEQRRAAEE